MTPKEKADELYDFFEHDLQFAIICVEQILEVCESYDNYNATQFSQVKYWKEVKKHLSDL